MVAIMSRPPKHQQGTPAGIIGTGWKRAKGACAGQQRHPLSALRSSPHQSSSVCARTYTHPATLPPSSQRTQVPHGLTGADNRVKDRRTPSRLLVARGNGYNSGSRFNPESLDPNKSVPHVQPHSLCEETSLLIQAMANLDCVKEP